MAYFGNNKICDFKMRKNIYRDLTSQATWHHLSLKKEMWKRLERTLDPNYKYMSNREDNGRHKRNVYNNKR